MTCPRMEPYGSRLPLVEGDLEIRQLTLWLLVFANKVMLSVARMILTVGTLALTMGLIMTTVSAMGLAMVKGWYGKVEVQKHCLAYFQD